MIRVADQAEERREAAIADHPMRRRGDVPPPRSLWDLIAATVVLVVVLLAGLSFCALGLWAIVR